MEKRVILVTGTPCVGKTTLCQKLNNLLSGFYINLTEFAQKENLIIEKDPQRDTAIIDETKMRRKLKQIIKKTENPNIIIDGHYAASIIPKALVTNIFVLRRNPYQLREFMKHRGYSLQKQSENLSAEILDVCLMEAIQKQAIEKICELDVSNQTLQETLTIVNLVLDGKQRCNIGTVDWIGLLEKEGKTDEYLNTEN